MEHYMEKLRFIGILAYPKIICALFMQGSKIAPIYVVMIPGEKGKELTPIRQGTKVSHHNLAHTFLEGVIA